MPKNVWTLYFQQNCTLTKQNIVFQVNSQKYLVIFCVNWCKSSFSKINLYRNVVFWDGDNFCKAFAGAQVNLSYHEWRSHKWYDIFMSAPAKALQKLSPSQKAILKLQDHKPLHNIQEFKIQQPKIRYIKY